MMPSGDNVGIDSSFLGWTDRDGDLPDSYDSGFPDNLTDLDEEGNHRICQIKVKIHCLDWGG